MIQKRQIAINGFNIDIFGSASASAAKTGVARNNPKPITQINNKNRTNEWLVNLIRKSDI